MKQIDAIFDEGIKEAAAIGATFNANDLFSKPFSFDDYPRTKARIDKMTAKMQSEIQTTVVNGITAEWENSNLINDQIAQRILGIKNTDDIPGKFKKYFNNNNAALQAFINRKEAGMKLSDRVWKYTNGFKQEIEAGLDIGIREGLPAGQMARDLKQYLQQPDKLFRRVRDQHGILQLSKNAKQYHPGQGVYRSSYKNAMRLTRTETNMAYRAADHERIQQLDFVVGIEVRLTNNPGHVYDICDELKGKYPKDFKFTGWHPHCMCHTVTILKTPEELQQDVEKIEEGKPTDTTSQNQVKDLPQNFKDWAEQNKDRIATAKSQPYFIRDNFKGTNTTEWFKQQPVASEPARPTAKEVNEARDQRKMPEELRNFLKHNPDAKIIEFKTEQLREKIIAWEQNNYNVTNTDKAKVDALVAMTKKQWDNLPPVIYERYTVEGGWKVIDGWHRTAAAIRRGETKINAVVKDYLTAAEKSAARHAARTPEQRAAIQKAWDERKAKIANKPLVNQVEVSLRNINAVIENEKRWRPNITREEAAEIIRGSNAYRARLTNEYINKLRLAGVSEIDIKQAIEIANRTVAVPNALSWRVEQFDRAIRRYERGIAGTATRTPAPAAAKTQKPSPVITNQVDDFKPQSYRMDYKKRQALENEGWTIKARGSGNIEDIYIKKMRDFNLTEFNIDLNALMKKNNMTVKTQGLFLQESKAEMIISGTYKGEKFRMIRTFKTDTKGKMYVIHEFLTIPKEMQGNGFTKELFQCLYKQYKNAGVEEIKVHANIDIGGYAWARYGFSVNKNKISEYLGGRIANKLSESQARQAIGIIEKYFKDNPKSNRFPMRLLADTPWGKDLLIKSNWYGNINLNNTVERVIFENYLYKGN
jgi:hypothetical protein